MSTRTSSPPRRLVDDRLWTLLEPLIPPPSRPRGPGGRPRRDDRLALEGILFVLTTGIGWAAAGVAAGRRVGRLHRAVLGELGRNGLLDWSRVCIDSVSVRAKRGAS